MGTRTLIATVVPVPDDASRTLLLRLHDQLRAGTPPATALATAARELATTADPATRVAALGFLCLGSG